MKTSINKAFISGNLTKGSGASRPRAVFRFSASAWRSTTTAKTTRRVNGRDYTNYLDCVLFGARAASLSRYLAKGTRVNIEGKLRWSQWESKDGGKRSKVEIVVDEIEFSSPRQREEAEASADIPDFGADYDLYGYEVKF